MKYSSKSSQKKSSKKSYFLVGSVLIITIVVISFLMLNNDSENTANVDSPKTTSTAPTAQEDFTGGEERPERGTNTDKGEAIVSDNQGSIEQVPDESSWSTSSTGEITLYSPTQNQLIQNGSVISGESSLPRVSFRVIDNVSGVISMGELAVVNGKFSGNISLSTTASEGRLDIFGARNDGSEFSTIEVGVRFR